MTDFAAAPYHLLRDRETYNEDGQQISEWSIRAEDVRAFLARKGPP